MNEDLTNRIVEYLELDTNYAIIINGGYGIGKTHYIKNELFPLVKNKSIPNSTTDEKFNPIPISLFGVNSIEDIQNQILLELYPILKSKGLKIAAGFGKSLIKHIAGFDISTMFSDTEISSSDLFDYSKILLCVDDIDRKSKELQLSEVFGYINNLVENYNAKVILVANEDELRKEINTETDRDNYSTLKEKVIGISVNFKSNVSFIYDQIIESKYRKTNELYHTFLTEHKNIIVQRIEQNSDNLRNLLFFLEHFKIIYNGLQECVFIEAKYNDLKADILNSFLEFTLPIAIEYKMGKLTPDNFESIQSIYLGTSFNFMDFLVKKETEEKPKSYIDEYKEKYIPTNYTKLMYFDSVFKYITGTSSLNIEAFSSEISSSYKFEDNTIPERERILAKLNYWDCVNFKYNKYRLLTNKLLGYVDNGEFSLEQYPIIFNYATRFENILNYNIENLKIRFKRGIKRNKDNFKFISNLHHKINIDKSHEYYSELKEITDYCIELNDRIKEDKETNEVNQLFTSFSQNFDTFLENVQDYNSDFLHVPFFVKFNFTQTWRTINKLTNLQKVNLGFYFKYRYREGFYSALYPEKKFLSDLKLKINDKIENKNTSRMEKTALKFLNMKTDESLSNFP